MLLPIATPPPVAAGECTLSFCGELYHYSPDDGFDDPIAVTCKGTQINGEFTGADGYTHWVAEGQKSTQYCQDVDGVYVYAYTEIWCKRFGYGSAGYGYYWEKEWDARGWHKISDGWDDGSGCTVRVD